MSFARSLANFYLIYTMKEKKIQKKTEYFVITTWKFTPPPKKRLLLIKPWNFLSQRIFFVEKILKILKNSIFQLGKSSKSKYLSWHINVELAMVLGSVHLCLRYFSSLLLLLLLQLLHHSKNATTILLEQIQLVLLCSWGWLPLRLH